EQAPKDVMAKRDAVFPASPHALYEAHGYSAAIRSEKLLFVSGQVGSRGDGSPEPDFGDQVRLAFANLKATLLAAGCGFDDIVDVTTFHTEPERQPGPPRLKTAELRSAGQPGRLSLHGFIFLRWLCGVWLRCGCVLPGYSRSGGGHCRRRRSNRNRFGPDAWPLRARFFRDCRSDPGEGR